MSGAADTPDEPVNGSVELNEVDLRTALLDMSGLLRARVAITLILAISFAGIFTMSGNEGWALKLQQLILPTVFLVVLWVSPYVSARRLLAVIAKGGDKHASYRFDDESVTLRTAGATTTIAYRSLVDYRDGRTAILLYTTPNVANIVPKRAFTPETLARVQTLLAAHVKPRSTPNLNRVIVLWLVAIFMFLVIWQFLNATSGPPPAV
jgi:hypothetical protein